MARVRRLLDTDGGVFNASRIMARPDNAVSVVDDKMLDAEGYVLRPDGTRDQRFKLPYAEAVEARNKRVQRKPAKERKAEIFSPETHDWEFVEEGFDPNGVKSASGARLKKFYVLRDRNTGETVYAGKGEVVKYAQLSIPSNREATVATDETAFVTSATPSIHDLLESATATL